MDEVEQIKACTAKILELTERITTISKVQVTEKPSPSSPAPEHLFTKQGLADWLQISPAWVEKRKDVLPRKRLGSGPKAPVRYDPQEVLRWIEDQTR